MEGELINLGIDPDVKEILDEHGDKLTQHENKIAQHDLEIKNLQFQGVEQKVILENIKDCQTETKKDVSELKNIILTQNNAMLNSMNNLIINKNDNETKKEINSSNNITKIILKVLGVIGIIIASLYTGGKVFS